MTYTLRVQATDGELTSGFSAPVSITASATSATVSAAAAPLVDDHTPVILVHSVHRTLKAEKAGTDCLAALGGLESYLRASGFTRTMRASYYTRDRNCNLDIAGRSGYHDDFHGLVAGKKTHTSLNGYTAHTGDAPIEHLAYHFAWTINDRFSQRGRRINIAAHSMGGLITRYALHSVGRNPYFPRNLLIGNVVTFGTPHQGSRVSRKVIAPFCPTTQCLQMGRDSSFILNDLANMRSPLGKWTAIGSRRDEIVSAESATSFGYKRVRYMESNQVKAPRHSGYQYHSPNNLGVYADVRRDPFSGYRRSFGPGSRAYIACALVNCF